MCEVSNLQRIHKTPQFFVLTLLHTRICQTTYRLVTAFYLLSSAVKEALLRLQTIVQTEG